MFISAFIFYHWLKEYLFPLNGRNRALYFWIPEMQKIFSNCSIENNDKIRTSDFIKAVSENYCINDDLKSKLINKLDPDENDMMYSKDELFIIFKDWISSGPTVEKAHQIMFTSPGCSYTSTPAARSGLLRRRLTRTRLFIHDDSPFYGSDEVDVDVSSSSSTKKRLSHHRSILESKLESFEKHASSLEKRYEDANSICASQKLEIERLKMELKTRQETEQTMEEIGEQIRKKEIETEKKCAKLQSELIQALTRIQDLDNMVIHLKEDLSSAENEILNGRDLLISLQIELKEKEQLNEEQQHKLAIIEQQKIDSEQALLNLLEENTGLINENIELKNNVTVYKHSHVEENGIPLCDELPSEMLQFPIENSMCAMESFASREVSVDLKSSYCQTEVDQVVPPLKDTLSSFSQTDIIMLSVEMSTGAQILANEMQSKSSQTHPCDLQYLLHTNHDQISVFSQTDMLIFDQAEMPSSSCQTEQEISIISTQTDLEMMSNWSQTEIRTMKLGYTQTELFSVDSKDSQTELAQSFSQQTELCESVSLSCQTEPSESQSSYSQTELFSTMSQTEVQELPSIFCQTEPFESHSNFTQTERFSAMSQTEVQELPSIFCQTEPFESHSNFTQTERFSAMSQTEVQELPSIFCQTEPFKNHSSSTQTERFSIISQTEVQELPSIFCQTEPFESQSSSTQTEMFSRLSQTEVQEVLSRSSQAAICGARRTAKKTDKRLQMFTGHSPAYSNTELSSNHQMFKHIPILRVLVKFVCLITSSLPSPNRVGRYVYSWVKFTFITMVSLLIALVAIFFIFFFVCQDNRCQLQLRYPRGMPPV